MKMTKLDYIKENGALKFHFDEMKETNEKLHLTIAHQDRMILNLKAALYESLKIDLERRNYMVD